MKASIFVAGLVNAAVDLGTYPIDLSKVDDKS